MRYQGTSITEAPTLTGAFGTAWRVRLQPVGQRERPDHDGTVGAFIVRAPNAHPLWDHYAINVMHLRPIEGVKPAHITSPGATHELMILALNPEEPLPPSLDAGPSWKLSFLRPIDVVTQFKAADDVVADEILELAIAAIVNGQISPDQDYRSRWTEAIVTTAEHFAAGKHSTGWRS